MQVSDASWDDVRFFLSLMRTRRLASSAKALGVDSSTMSRRLVRLEELLGFPLFDRRREGLAPTEAALELLPAAQEMEHASHGFNRQLDSLEREVEGPVRISTPPGVAESFVAPLLQELVRLYPRLRFEVDASTRQADLLRREADIAIRVIKPSGGPLVRQRLHQSRWIPMAAPGLSASLGLVKRWSDVPWVGWGFELERLHASRWLTTRVKSPPVLKTNSFAMQVSAVQRGLGAALLPEPYMAVHQLAPLQLSRPLASDVKSVPSDDLWLVAHEALRHVPRVAAVWEHLVNAFR